MCTLGAAGLALGALSSGASALGARQQARMQYQAQLQQNEMQRRMQAQAAEAERQRAGQEATSIVMRQRQEEQAVNEELNQINLKSKADFQRGVTAAGESNVTGQSVIAYLDDFKRLEGAYRSSLGRQQAERNIATGLNLEQVALASQQRLMGINQPISDPIRPRGLGISDVLSVASGGLQGYMAGRSLSGGSSNPDIYVSDGYTSKYMPKTDQYSIPTPGY